MNENSELRDFNGLDQDSQPIKYPTGKYFDCLNMRIISDEGLTTGALENIKGNSYFRGIPDTGPVARITLVEAFDPDDIPGTITIDIAGTSNIYTPVYTATLAEFLQGIVDFINSGVYPGFKAYLDSKESAIYIIDLAGGNTSPSIIITASAFYTFLIQGDYIQPQGQLRIIGWVVLREDIYILTTNVATANPGGVDPDLPPDPDGVGQIWKIVYDKITKVAITPELIYNNYVNFTIQHPIANPGGIEARYENIQIQRIYWTDNFNKPRTLNVADPNAYALDPDRLDIGTRVEHTFPINQYLLLSGGALASGVHQIAYRLKNTGGSTTAFSVPSNIMCLTDKPEYLNYGAELYTDLHFEGADPGTPTSKAIQYEIKYLDTAYDRVEVVSLYRENINDSPIINIINDDPVPPDGIYRFTYTGNEIGVPITLNEFTGRSVDFIKVKTIAQKNNRLFSGNIKRTSFDLQFDARTFRFPLSGISTPTDQTDVLNKSGVATTIDTATWTPATYSYADYYNYLAENHDAIQDYASQAPDDWTNNLYQPSSVSAGSAVVGGAGRYVNYSFVPYLSPNLYTHILDTRNIGNSSAINSRSPYRQSDKYSTLYTLGIQDQYFPINGAYQDNHSALVSGLLRSYMRDEMYRFALVFYDLQGNPGFANWIGDIRFPHIWMPDTTNATSTVRTMQNPLTTFDPATDICTGYPMGIVFNINLAGLADEDRERISGFSIVRCKRNEIDKHILGQGALWPAVYNNSLTGAFLMNGGANAEANPGYGGSEYYADILSISCPDFQFKDNPIYTTGDEIEVLAHIETTQLNTIAPWNLPSNAGMIAVKNYDFSTTLASINDATSLNPYTIDGSLIFKPWFNNKNSQTDVNANKVWNESFDDGVVGHVSAGGDILCLTSGEWRDDYGDSAQNPAYKEFAATDGYTGDHSVYLGNYRRTPIDQYGGNSYQNRSNSEYIPCGNFVPVDYNVLTYGSFAVFGGDTFLVLYDTMRQHANVDVDYVAEAHMRGNIFPVETSINTELRQAKEISGSEVSMSLEMKFRYVMNKQAIPATTAIGIAAKEEFTYNQVYSAETDYIKYFPKPDPFIPNEEFDNRIYSSEVKVNGELADSWGVFKEANYLDVDGIVGPINNLITLTNDLLFFQTKGVGKAAVEERAAVATSSGDLTIGTSGVLSRFDYISRETGSSHQFGFTKNDNTVWFYDSIAKKLMQLNPEGQIPLSDIKGMHSKFATLTGDILINDNPYYSYGVSATYDFKNREAIFTFKDTNQSFTLSYNTLSQSFISRYSFTPAFYINDKYNLITPDETNQRLYIHENGPYGTFYDTLYQSSLTILSNKEPFRTKILPNIEWLTEVFDSNVNELRDNTWNHIRIRTNRQNTDYQLVSDLSRRLERTWNIQVPKDRVLNNIPNPNIYTDISPNRIAFGKKLRDKYYFTDLVYDNINNYRLVMDYIIFNYRISPR